MFSRSWTLISCLMELNVISYNVLGEILDIMKFKNILTGEEICQMTIESNDIQFDICINSKDLLGEPAVGRRFKGTIWLQGQLHY